MRVIPEESTEKNTYLLLLLGILYFCKNKTMPFKLMHLWVCQCLFTTKILTFIRHVFTHTARIPETVRALYIKQKLKSNHC